MARKVITGKLSVDGINSIIKQLEQYQQRLNEANKIFVERLTAMGMNVAYTKVLSTVGYDKDKRQCDVSATYSSAGALQYAVLYLNGEEALYVEFGSGKRHNPYPNPLAGLYGYGVGTNSIMGHWDDPDGWWYVDDNGNPHHSFGVGASMPMFYAKYEMVINLVSVAKEVFQSVI